MVKGAHLLEVAICSALSAAMLFMYVLIKSGAAGHIQKANNIVGQNMYNYSLENEDNRNDASIPEPKAVSR